MFPSRSRRSPHLPPRRARQGRRARPRRRLGQRAIFFFVRLEDRLERAPRERAADGWFLRQILEPAARRLLARVDQLEEEELRAELLEERLERQREGSRPRSSIRAIMPAPAARPVA
ncbi:MAG: hypothetical protein U0527_05900 [Candidatus Eisenbacteria bacterium]